MEPPASLDEPVVTNLIGCRHARHRASARSAREWHTTGKRLMTPPRGSLPARAGIAGVYAEAVPGLGAVHHISAAPADAG